MTKPVLSKKSPNNKSFHCMRALRADFELIDGDIIYVCLHIMTGLPVAAAGFGYLAYKRYNHPGEREKRKIRAEYLELTRRCKMTAENIGQAIKGCQSNLDNMKDLVYEEDSETDEFWR